MGQGRYILHSLSQALLEGCYDISPLTRGAQGYVITRSEATKQSLFQPVHCQQLEKIRPLFFYGAEGGYRAKLDIG